MPTDPQFELEELGLLPAEAQVYLALIRNGSLAASAIASLTEIPRSSVYPTLNSLVDKGLVEAGTGYGSRFTAIPAERALPALIRHERDQLSHRESLVIGLSKHLASLVEPAEDIPEELIQVIRNPRAIGERFDRLQLEAEHQIDVFSKAPIFNRPGNPAEAKVLRRGLRARSIYERAVLDDPAVKPFLASWIAAGEEGRVYEGVLPHKLAIFDSKAALMPLIMPGKQVKAVLIQNPQLVQTLSLGFEHLWERSKPLTAAGETPISSTPKPTLPSKQRISPNGRLGQSAKK